MDDTSTTPAHSPGPATTTVVETGVKALNPHVRYLNFDDHGNSVVDITRERLQVDWSSSATGATPGRARTARSAT